MPRSCVSCLMRPTPALNRGHGTVPFELEPAPELIADARLITTCSERTGHKRHIANVFVASPRARRSHHFDEAIAVSLQRIVPIG